MKIHFKNNYQLFCAKNRSKKHQIFTKLDHFKNRPSYKGYSPCEILTLGQKLKLQKTCQNLFYKSFKVVLQKNPLEKTPNIREIRPFLKSAILQRLQPMQNSHFGSKIKILKNMSKSILQIIYSCSVQKPLQKHQIFKKLDHFKNRPSCKGYSPCEILTLGQKLKLQKTCQNLFYKSFRVVLRKNPLKKTPNIREIRPFLKSAILQRLQHMQNSHFGSKIKILKNMSRSILQIIYSCSVQKTAPKNTKYSRN